MLFGKSIEYYEYYAEFQYGNSPTIRWSIRMHNSDIRRYVKGLFSNFKKMKNKNWDDHLSLIQFAYIIVSFYNRYDTI